MRTATSWSSPGPEGPITAKLTDPDGGVTDVSLAVGAGPKSIDAHRR